MRQSLRRTSATALSRFTKPLPTSQYGAFAVPVAALTGVAVASSAWRTWVGVRAGRACLSTAAAPAMCGEAIEVPDAVVFSPGGHGPTTVPVESQVEEMSTPGAVTSGCTRPIRSPV